MRLFLAVEIPEEWRDALLGEERRLEEAAPGAIRWVGPQSLHVTLAFLGNQPAALVPTITEAAEAAASRHAAFTLHPGSLGSFGGSGRQLRVIWAGVEDEPPGALGNLRSSVTRALVERRVPFDRTPFRAHITLGRARRDGPAGRPAAMGQAMAQQARWGGELQASCDEVVLFRSELRPTGAIHTALHRAKLAAGIA